MPNQQDYLPPTELTTTEAVAAWREAAKAFTGIEAFSERILIALVGTAEGAALALGDYDAQRELIEKASKLALHLRNLQAGAWELEEKRIIARFRPAQPASAPAPAAPGPKSNL